MNVCDRKDASYPSTTNWRSPTTNWRSLTTNWRSVQGKSFVCNAEFSNINNNLHAARPGVAQVECLAWSHHGK